MEPEGISKSLDSTKPADTSLFLLLWGTGRNALCSLGTREWIRIFFTEKSSPNCLPLLAVLEKTKLTMIISNMNCIYNKSVVIPFICVGVWSAGVGRIPFEHCRSSKTGRRKTGETGTSTTKNEDGWCLWGIAWGGGWHFRGGCGCRVSFGERGTVRNRIAIWSSQHRPLRQTLLKY